MKNKILFIAIFFLTLSAFPFGGSYCIRCYKCRENTLKINRGYSSCMGCQAWRCYGAESRDVFKGYMVYKCHHGHTLLIPKNSDPKTFDLNEILVQNADGTRSHLKYPNGIPHN